MENILENTQENQDVYGNQTAITNNDESRGGQFFTSPLTGRESKISEQALSKPAPLGKFKQWERIPVEHGKYRLYRWDKYYIKVAIENDKFEYSYWFYPSPVDFPADLLFCEAWQNFEPVDENLQNLVSEGNFTPLDDIYQKRDLPNSENKEKYMTKAHLEIVPSGKKII